MELPRVGSDSALQAPLYTLAVDTGGRALFNSNSMDGSIRQALSETSEYYLLAWRPETAEQRSDSLRQIQVTVKDHPELTVRVHKGYLPAAAKAPADATPAASPASASTQVVEAKMIEALSTLYPIPDLPTSVNVRFSDEAGKGAELMVATEISTGNLFRATLDSADSRTVDMMGAVLDDQGKTVANFKGQLKAVAPSATAGDSISQTTEVKIKPGLYQVRVAAREPRTGVTGSASQWVLVPDLTKGQIALSSLFMGDRQPRPGTDSRVPLSISHHFTPASRLRFFASIYNAARGPNSNTRPDLTLQASILRDNESLFTSPLVKIATEGVDDLGRIPYAAEISLRTLSPGSYVLQVIATDNLSKTSATQRAKFVVE
jgi:hypothetical protein